ncbi:hypothetical protein [Cellulomonas sp. ATA003]|uniref:hypothetical protein n=1 Tax=Cellulomonas sp. ATA003 TaxID=3073064 RepID=UPI0028735F28|nr:hypothetical protein [Cellulomonas sp. ATA003]WNB84559.1 hypothetical protein REH70_12055 [Cellulomonas sp. ATA003]
MGVYLTVVESFDAPALTATDERLRELGYQPGGHGELACDQGAAEALGLDPQTIAASVYFASEADARRFAEAYGPDVVGVAAVTVFCRD